MPVVEDATHVESATVHIAELTFDAAFAAAASTTGKTERHLCLKLSSIDGLCMYVCMGVCLYSTFFKRMLMLISIRST